LGPEVVHCQSGAIALPGFVADMTVEPTDLAPSRVTTNSHPIASAVSPLLGHVNSSYGRRRWTP
jgi:hypothetical protein